jgi:2'-5' RNA ligase
MDSFHIGIRLRGFSKSFFKIQKAKSNNNNNNIKYVPHITLLRPFYTTDENQLIENFNNTLSQYKDPIKFQITDFDYFDNDKKIIHGKIKQNHEIEKMIDSLESNLEKIIQFKHPKIGNKINLHTTISEEPDLSIIKYLDNMILPIDQYLLRVYLLKHHENTKQKLILREYDFYLNRSLTREEAKDKELFKETINQFTKKTGLIPTYKGFTKK